MLGLVFGALVCDLLANTSRAEAALGGGAFTGLGKGLKASVTGSFADGFPRLGLGIPGLASVSFAGPNPVFPCGLRGAKASLKERLSLITPRSSGQWVFHSPAS